MGGAVLGVLAGDDADGLGGVESWDAQGGVAGDVRPALPVVVPQSAARDASGRLRQFSGGGWVS